MLNQNARFARRELFRALLGVAALLLVVAPVSADGGGGVAFQDIAAGDNAGITYRRVPSASQAIFDAFTHQPVYTFNDLPFTPLESRGMPGVAILDFDGDDDLDLYVTNGPGAENSLYSNQLQETGQVTFVEVGPAAGVGAVAQDSTGVCFGDVDNDGDEDLYVLGNHEPNLLFENQGDGAFTDITQSSGTGAGNWTSSSCAMGDVNGDGLLDIVVANTYTDWTNQLTYYGVPFAYNEHNQLFLNTGDNVFVDVSATSGIENLAGFPPELDGTAGISWAVAMVDYDLDGDVDLIFGQDQSAPLAKDGGVDHGFIRIFQNDGTGYFVDATLAANMDHVGQWLGLSFGDLNCDGSMDIFGGNVGDYGYTILYPVFLYDLGQYATRWFLGQPDGTFTDPGVGDLIATPFGWGTSMTDYDNDGDTDVVFYGGSVGGCLFVESSNPGTILQNDGCSANFTIDADALAGSTNHTRRTVMGLATGDLDRNGFVDIVSISSHDQPEPIPLWRFPISYGSPFDANAWYVPISYPTETFGVYTWSGDEYPNGTLSIEINDGDNGNKWAQVELLGTIGLTSGGSVNRDGIGAVVKFTPKRGDTVMQPILGGSSRGSQDSLMAEFGLGSANKGTVEVLWPGGVRNRLYNVHQFERVVFPEIPCSFDGDWDKPSEYHACVKDTLDELVQAGVLDHHDRARFLSSAMKALHDH
jgi:hypothetical protein